MGQRSTEFMVVRFLHIHNLESYKIRTGFTVGEVRLEESSFLGCNSVICAPVTIGWNSVIAAGSIITKDIPPNELWDGVPAKFIKKLEFINNKNQ